MILIQYKDSAEKIPVTFQRTDEHVVTLRGSKEPNASGFLTYRLDGETQLGDFSDYRTIYRVTEDSVSYSNDGSVWQEPEPPSFPDAAGKPTLEDRVETLEATTEEQGVTMDDLILIMADFIGGE